MKILCDNTDPKLYYTRLGLTSVLRILGHEVIEWDSRTKPAFDVFDENEPDIVLATEETLSSRPVTKCLCERGDGIQTVRLDTISTAADTVNFRYGRMKPQYTSQVVYVGNYNPEAHDKIILPLCHSKNNLQVKICGYKPWPVPNYLGPIRDENLRHFYASSAVSLSLGDPERVYQILTSGGLPVSMKFNHYAFNPSNVVMAPTPEDLLNSVLTYSRQGGKDTKRMWRAGMDAIIHKHTYWHRVAAIFEYLGLEEEAARTLKTYGQ